MGYHTMACLMAGQGTSHPPQPSAFYPAAGCILREGDRLYDCSPARPAGACAARERWRGGQIAIKAAVQVSCRLTRLGVAPAALLQVQGRTFGETRVQERRVCRIRLRRETKISRAIKVYELEKLAIAHRGGCNFGRIIFDFKF